MAPQMLEKGQRMTDTTNTNIQKYKWVKDMEIQIRLPSQVAAGGEKGAALQDVPHREGECGHVSIWDAFSSHSRTWELSGGSSGGALGSCPSRQPTEPVCSHAADSRGR